MAITYPIQPRMAKMPKTATKAVTFSVSRANLAAVVKGKKEQNAVNQNANDCADN